MKEVSAEWIAKAEGDFTTALREHRARRHPNFDAACFHAQQCIEKYLKAAMVEKGIPFRKIHDLEVLLDQCTEAFPLWSVLRGDAQLLTQYAVQFRYPGDTAARAESREALGAMRRMRREIRVTFGLGPGNGSKP